MKSPTKFLLGLIFFVFALHAEAAAQQDFKLTGVLLEKGEKIRVALAVITDLRNGSSVGSNDLGLFTINASVGDTLLVTKRNYSELKVVVQSNKDLVLYLYKGNTLNEVVVVGQTKKQALDEIRQDYKDKGVFYGGKPPLALLSPFGGSPLTFLYELFGRTPKNARRFGRMYTSEMQQSQVDAYYNKTTINKYTGLEGKELETFMVTYRPDYDVAKNWAQYDAVKWINDSFKKYSASLKTRP